MGGNGGEMGCYGGEVGANNKKCGARVDWFGFPIFPHFPPFFLGCFHQCTPTIALLPIKTMFFGLFSPQFPIFPSSIQNFPHFSPFSPIFPKSAHFG